MKPSDGHRFALYECLASKCILLTRALTLLFFTLNFSIALAEPVLIETASGERGHGWLFRPSAGDSDQCWVALPFHIVDERDDSIQPFVFSDRTGRRGESGKPVAVIDVPGGLKASMSVEDLAFAPVRRGFDIGDCLSRLGLPSLSYDALLRRGAELRVLSLLPGSFGVLELSVEQVRSDVVRGGMLALDTLHEDDAERYFKKGISGAVATHAPPTGVVPFAMILEVDANTGLARAVRFDLVRNSFEKLLASLPVEQTDQGSVQAGVMYEVVGYDGVPMDPSILADALKSVVGCWRVKRAEGERQITIDLQTESAVRRIEIDHNCGEPFPFHIDYRPQGGNWARARSCHSSEASGDGCALDLSGPLDLRIIINEQQSVAISRITLR